MENPVATLSVLMLSAAAGLCLRTAWRRQGDAWGLAISGWALAGLSFVPAVLAFGVGPGVFMALTAFPLVLLIIVAAGSKYRPPVPAKPRKSVVMPGRDSPGVWRLVLAGPLSGVSAIGAGLALAMWLPGAPDTRLLTGGLCVPLIWAGCMVGTLTWRRSRPAAVTLICAALAGFALAALKGAVT